MINIYKCLNIIYTHLKNIKSYLICFKSSDLLLLEIFKNHIDEKIDISLHIDDLQVLNVNASILYRINKKIEKISRNYNLIDVKNYGDEGDYYEIYNYNKLELIINQLKREEKLKNLGI